MGEKRPDSLEIDKLQALCRQHGLYMTNQRRAVLVALAPRLDHPTADQILDDVRRRTPGISRTTVYRVLEAMVRTGVVRKVCNPGAAVRYEVETKRHHHLVCLNCEKIVDLRDPTLDALPLPSKRSGFRIADYAIQFRGLCARCAEKKTSRRSRSVLPIKTARKRERGEKPAVR